LIVEGERGASAPRWVSDPGSPSNAIGELTHPARYAVPQVDVAVAKRTFAAVHAAIAQGLVRACHDPSEGGLAVALAEMAFAGGCGARIRLADFPASDANLTVLLFAESASRFVLEVERANRSALEAIFQKHNVPLAEIGEVTGRNRLQIEASGPLIDLPISELKEAWQKPLRW
jgi:phosphoribosylformylglycinamidine (FGAM) synthase-like enzyme